MGVERLPIEGIIVNMYVALNKLEWHYNIDNNTIIFLRNKLRDGNQLYVFWSIWYQPLQ